MRKYEYKLGSEMHSSARDYYKSEDGVGVRDWVLNHEGQRKKASTSKGLCLYVVECVMPLSLVLQYFQWG